MTHFGTASTGDDVVKRTIQNGDLTVSLLSWGATVHEVRLNGVDHNLTLNADTIEGYEGEYLHYGTLIGPIANRISPARVTIDGMTYELERNQTDNIHLHSGKQATHRQNWIFAEVTETRAVMTLDLIDGACGLPGNRVITAVFEVLPQATLRLTITGTTDAKTVMNFANHSYWNLDGSESYDGHSLQIAADHYLPCDADNLATGEVADVTDTPMDFRKARVVKAGEPPFDHNFCLSDKSEPLRDVMTLRGASGLEMTMATDQAGLQIYDARSPSRPGKGPHEGLVFEAQAWPNAPYNPRFPSIEITPEAPYSQTTEWRFRQNS